MVILGKAGRAIMGETPKFAYKLQFGLFFLPLPSHKHRFYGVTSGFTRLIMKTKYVFHSLSPFAKLFP